MFTQGVRQANLFAETYYDFHMIRAKNETRCTQLKELQNQIRYSNYLIL